MSTLTTRAVPTGRLRTLGPVTGRIAIGVWLLMFAALGVALMRADS